MIDTDVVIIGGGASAIFSAVISGWSGLHVRVVHLPSPGGFASSNNLGWLHCGGLELCYRGHEEAAVECMMASGLLRSLFSENVRLTPALFVFPKVDEHHFDSFLHRAEALSYPARVVSSEKYAEAMRSSSSRNSSPPLVVRGSEYTFDARSVLSRAVTMAQSAGASFMNHAAIGTRKSVRSARLSDGRWLVELMADSEPTEAIRTRGVILAAADKNDELLKAFNIDWDSTKQFQNLQVLHLDTQTAVNDAIVFYPRQHGFPMLVPCYEVANGIQLLIGSNGENFYSDEEYARVLSVLFPDIDSDLPATGHFRTCRRYTGRSVVVDGAQHGSAGVVALYSGKFTTSLHTALDAVGRLGLSGDHKWQPALPADLFISGKTIQGDVLVTNDGKIRILREALDQ